MTFLFNTKIKLYQTDAAGILFYSHIFTIAHDAYDVFLDKIGFTISDILNHSDYRLPYIHAEADYFFPLTAGDAIQIRLNVERIGTTSYTIIYSFFDNNEKLAAFVKTVHVVTDKKSKKKMKIPEDLLAALSNYLKNNDEIINK